jgi:hypothetical protein
MVTGLAIVVAVICVVGVGLLLYVNSAAVAIVSVRVAVVSYTFDLYGLRGLAPPTRRWLFFLCSLCVGENSAFCVSGI